MENDRTHQLLTPLSFVSTVARKLMQISYSHFKIILVFIEYMPLCTFSITNSHHYNHKNLSSRKQTIKKEQLGTGHFPFAYLWSDRLLPILLASFCFRFKEPITSLQILSTFNSSDLTSKSWALVRFLTLDLKQFLYIPTLCIKYYLWNNVYMPSYNDSPVS